LISACLWIIHEKSSAAPDQVIFAHHSEIRPQGKKRLCVSQRDVLTSKIV